MANVFDTAEYILAKLNENGEAFVSTMKLQKLCYYSQAWNLAWDNKPIFGEPIEAWINGPVVDALFQKHKGCLNVKSGFSSGNPQNLAQDEIETIDSVINAYGHLDGFSLGSLTHAEDPWIAARGGMPSSHRSHAVITNDSMRDYYAAQFAQQA